MKKVLKTMLLFIAVAVLATAASGGAALASSTNIALGKYAGFYKVSDDSVNTNLFSPAWRILDGDKSSSTSYGQAHTDLSYIVINLMGRYEIDGIEITPHAEAYPDKYSLYTSLDGTNWTLYAQESSGGGSAKSYPGEAAAVYIKFLPDSFVSTQYAIMEIEVLGAECENLATASNTTPVDSTTGNRVQWFWPAAKYENLFVNDGSFAQPSEVSRWGLLTDLGDYYDVDTLQYCGYWASFITDGKIEVSSDGVNFDTAATIGGEYAVVYDTAVGLETRRFYKTAHLARELPVRYVRLTVNTVGYDSAICNLCMMYFAVYGEKVTVSNDPEGITIGQDSLTDGETLRKFGYGEQIQLRTTFDNPLAVGNIEWSSSNDKCVVVSDTGVATVKRGNEDGFVEITASVAYEDKRYSDTVKLGLMNVVDYAVYSSVSVKGTASFYHSYKLATDGNKSTFCQPAENVDISFVFDMGSEVKLGQIRMYFNVFAPDKVTVFTSSDKETWSEVTSLTSPGVAEDVCLDWQNGTLGSSGIESRFVKVAFDRISGGTNDTTMTVGELALLTHDSVSLSDVDFVVENENKGPASNYEYEYDTGSTETVIQVPVNTVEDAPIASAPIAKTAEYVLQPAAVAVPVVLSGILVTVIVLYRRRMAK
ncbi:MAG: discoidin domain-containing protein [Christensenellales bacterium]